MYYIYSLKTNSLLYMTKSFDKLIEWAYEFKYRCNEPIKVYHNESEMK